MTNVQSGTGVLAGDERMFIDGELRYTDSGATFDAIHPASAEVAGQATDGTVEDMRRAVGARSTRPTGRVTSTSDTTT